ncbi:MAG: TylF/MycF/NovP-related O-methyltransferase [Verrucomicrobiales bacterium]
MNKQITPSNEIGSPDQNLARLRRLIPKSLQPSLRGLRKRWQRKAQNLAEPFWSVFPYSQVSLAKQENLIRLGGLVEMNQVEGAIVECGVLDGGCSALMAFATAASGRPVHMFDSWEGLPETTGPDGEQASKWTGECVGSPARVMAVMNELKIDGTRLHFHRGWFHETFPTVDIPSVAMLHIDCDFYEPTLLCLETWYELLSPGGYIQIDDYDCFQGSRRATNEFISRHPELLLHLYEGEVGGQAYYFQKPARAGQAPAQELAVEDLVA